MLVDRARLISNLKANVMRDADRSFFFCISGISILEREMEWKLLRAARNLKLEAQPKNHTPLIASINARLRRINGRF